MALAVAVLLLLHVVFPRGNMFPLVAVVVLLFPIVADEIPDAADVSNPTTWLVLLLLLLGRRFIVPLSPLRSSSDAEEFELRRPHEEVRGPSLCVNVGDVASMVREPLVLILVMEFLDPSLFSESQESRLLATIPKRSRSNCFSYSAHMFKISSNLCFSISAILCSSFLSSTILW